MNKPMRLSSGISAPGSGPVLMRILDKQALLALGPEWEELIQHALEENAYYGRQYAQALLEHVEKRPVHAVSVWHGPRLIALMPYVSAPLRWGGLARVNKTWRTPYTPMTVPLIDRREAIAAIAGLVDAMSDGTTGADAWLLLDMTLDGPVNRALSAEWHKRDMEHQVYGPFERAILTHGDTFDTHMKSQVSKKRRKDLVRNRKRLAELGTLHYERHTDGKGLECAVEDFLRIEAAGWKGAAGTALDCSTETRAFARQAFGTWNRQSVTRADLLRLNGQAIAVNLSLQTGRTAFTIKCAFDETYRTQSAGLLLEEDMIRDFLEGDWADTLDSATAPGHLIQSLWNGSIRVGDLLVDARTGGGSLSGRLRFRAEDVRRFAHDRLKQAVHAYRARRS